MKSIVHQTAWGAIFEKLAAFERKSSDHYHMGVRRWQIIQAEFFFLRRLPYGKAYSSSRLKLRMLRRYNQDCYGFQQDLYSLKWCLRSWKQPDGKLTGTLQALQYKIKSDAKHSRWIFDKIFSLNLLSQKYFHMVMLNVGVDMKTFRLVSTEMIVPVLNTACTE